MSNSLDEIRMKAGGDNPALWLPADWADFLHGRRIKQQDALLLAQQLVAMPHWDVVELWDKMHCADATAKEWDERMDRAASLGILNDDIGSNPALYAEVFYRSHGEIGNNAEKAVQFCKHLRRNLQLLMDSQFKHWDGLKRWIGYRFNLECTADERVDYEQPMEVKGVKICLSGKMQLEPELYGLLIVAADGMWVSTVNQYTDALVVGDWAGQKVDDAIKHNVALHGESALRAALSSALEIEDEDLNDFAHAAAAEYGLIEPMLACESGVKTREKRMPGNHAKLKSADAIPASVAGLKICITGTLDRKRSEYAKLITAAGGTFSEKLLADCSLLVVGEGGGSKVKLAKKRGLLMCSLADLRKMLGIE